MAVALAFVALVAMLAFAPALADPPGRVGRISVVEGDATLQGAEASALRAEVNWPVSSGFVLQTAPRARAEVRVGSIALRVDDDTTLRFVRIDDASVALALDRGSLALRLRARDTVPEVSVQTPEGVVTFADVGRYRVDTGRVPGTVVVSTDRGHARVAAPEIVVDVRSGRAVELAGGAARFVTVLADTFDDWTLARDRRDDAVAQGFVSPEMTGYEDLAAHGDWRTTASYGAVWVPRTVATGWAPYRFGRWQWIAPWGWTWIDDAPWGFAPFHYGRWAFIDGFWGWVPGTWVARPVWAPALVGWVGRPGWSVTFAAGGFAAAGWFPLAPREPFFPWYRASPVYVQNINITQVTNINVNRPPAGAWNGGAGAGMGAGNAMGGMGAVGTAGGAGVTSAPGGGGNALGGMGLGSYANAQLPNAITVAPAAALAQGQRIAGSPINLPMQQLAGAQPIAPITPALTGATRGTAGGLGAVGAGTAASQGGGTLDPRGGAQGSGGAGTGGYAATGSPNVGASSGGLGAGPGSGSGTRGGVSAGAGGMGAATTPTPTPSPGAASDVGTALPRGLAGGAATGAGLGSVTGGMGGGAIGSASPGTAVGAEGRAPVVPLDTRAGRGPEDGPWGGARAPGVPVAPGTPAGLAPSAAPESGARSIAGGLGASAPRTIDGTGTVTPRAGGGLGSAGGVSITVGPSHSAATPAAQAVVPRATDGSSANAPSAGGIGVSVGAPAPSYRPTSPSYGSATPSYGAPGSGGMGGIGGSVGAPSPTYRPPSPSYGGPRPSYGSPGSGGLGGMGGSVGAPAPTYRPPASAYGSAGPSYAPAPRTYSPPVYSPPAYSPPARAAPPMYNAPPSGGYGMGGMGGGMRPPSGGFAAPSPPPVHAPSGGQRGSAGGFGGMGGR